LLRHNFSFNWTSIFQIPPDLVVKSQPTDIIDIIL